MQTSKHFSLFQLIAVIFISNFCISSCEIPIPNNFGSAPEYGHILYPDQQYQDQSTTNNTSTIFESYWNDSSKHPNTEENSLEALSSVPQLHYHDDNIDNGESESYYNSGEAINDILEPDYRFHHSNDESLLYENNQNEISNNNQHNGRGFEAPSSSSSLIQLLMSPLSKPFSLIPSVFRKGKKKRRGGKRRARRRRRNRRHPSTIKKVEEAKKHQEFIQMMIMIMMMI
jgi:hypothetical protein